MKTGDLGLLLLMLGALAACDEPDATDAGTSPADASLITDSGPADTGQVADLGVQTDGGAVLDAVPADVEPGQDVETSDADASAADVDLSPDAEPATDATPSDTGGYGPVTVIFRQSGQPAVGQAFFNDQNGVLISATTATIATADVPAGGMVTIVESLDSQDGTQYTQLSTLVDVLPNEVYIVDREPSSQVLLGEMGFSAGTAFPGAQRYHYDFGCGALSTTDPVTPLPLEVFSGCSGSSTIAIDVLASAIGPNNVLLAYQAERVLVLIGGEANLTGVWQTDLPTIVVTGQNEPPGQRTLGASVYLSLGDQYFGPYYANADLLTPTDGATVGVPIPNFGDGLLYSMSLSTVIVGRSSVVLGRSTGLTNPTVDLTTDFLHDFFTSPTMTRSATRPDRPSFSWGAPTDPASLTAISVSTGPNIIWNIAFPNGRMGLDLPELPASLAALAPTATTPIFSYCTVVPVPGVADYEAYRASLMPSFTGVGYIGASALQPGQTTKVTLTTTQ